MSTKPEIVVIGASTGGLVALQQIAAGLPDDFSAAVIITKHIGSYQSSLPDLLSAHSVLPVRYATHEEAICAGQILVAPPDHHVLVEPGRVILSHGPKENFARPAIDPLFRTTAAAYRNKAIGVVLTGSLDDGTVGLQAIKAYGGRAIVQDPDEAEAPSMPLSAIENVAVDYCLTLDEIVKQLVRLVNQSVGKPAGKKEGAAIPSWIEIENAIVTGQEESLNALQRIGTPSMFTCPECHGSLWQVDGVEPPRFRCHTGHAFTARTFALAQEQVAEEALWAAVRALHEKESLLKNFEKKAHSGKHPEAAAEYAAAADLARQHADALLRMITDRPQAPSLI